MSKSQDKSQKSKVILITGATSGVGRETALGLAQKNVQLVLPVRNRFKGEELKKELLRLCPECEVHIMDLDLSSLQSVKAFADQFLKKFPKLDVLINNAGLINTRFELTQDGYESTFATNHLGHFLLTHLLLDHLKKAGTSGSTPARVINVSSQAHRQFKLRSFDEFNMKGEKKYFSFKAYSLSKLANIMFTNAMAEKMKDIPVTFNSLHPGVVATGFGHNQSGFFKFLVTLGRPFMISSRKGAQTSIYLATAPEMDRVTGTYFVNKKPSRPSHLNRSQSDQLMEQSYRMVQPFLNE